MEKLIGYLNDYLDDGQEWLYACYPLDDDFDKFFHTKDGEGTIEEAQVISKRFGFIQWLVDNDKIDYNKEDFIVNACHYIHNASNYEGLLMLLSIQDNPIDFLVSILK